MTSRCFSRLKAWRPFADLKVCALAMSALVGAIPVESQAGQTWPEFSKTYCLECHDAATEKGKLNLEGLTWHASDAHNRDVWVKIFDRVTNGEMPPAKKPRPTAAELQPLMAALSSRLQADQTQSYAREGRAHRRRLNREEYQNTLRDLFGTPDLNIIDLLPADGSAFGFDTVDSALTLSPVQVEKYLEAADKAINAALGPAKAPNFKQVHYSYIDDQARRNVHMTQLLPDAMGFTVSRGDFHPYDLGKVFSAPAGGRYRIRVSAYGWHSGGKPVVMRLFRGGFGVGGHAQLIGYYEVPPDKATVIDTETVLDWRETIKPISFGLPGNWMNSTLDYNGPALAIQWMEIEGPMEAKVWPPASRAKLLGNVDPSKGTEKDVQDIVRNFAQRAFRRPVAAEELAPYLDFISQRFRDGAKFDDALRAGLKAVLVSPRFLELGGAPGPLDAYGLASRLSYFLWSTMPDEALFAAAAQGELTPGAKLRAQVERMLKDPKAHAFTENFTGQWLSLRNIDSTSPDPKLYPEFDDWLKLSMLRETHAFFDEVLTHDLSVTNFVQSDFAMLNERLAQHYGVPDVQGLEIRHVPVKPESNRGGVLAQGAILKVTANGTSTSPVVRGSWILDHLMGQPVPPPPGNVAALEPDTRGATTIREQLDKHRKLETCALCHTKMDPLGFAMENFDVIGGWRERYRIMPEKGKRVDQKDVQTSFSTVKVALGPKVDASSTLADGHALADFTELKKLLVAHPDQLAHCLTEKLMVYGTGHRVEFADRSTVDSIVHHAQSRNYGLRTLLLDVIQSPTFLNQ